MENMQTLTCVLFSLKMKSYACASCSGNKNFAFRINRLTNIEYKYVELSSIRRF